MVFLELFQPYPGLSGLSQNAPSSLLSGLPGSRMGGTLPSVPGYDAVEAVEALASTRKMGSWSCIADLPRAPLDKPSLPAGVLRIMKDFFADNGAPKTFVPGGPGAMRGANDYCCPCIRP